MKELELIDNELNRQFEKLSEITKAIKFELVAQFKIEEANEKIQWDQIQFPGIYLFEIKNDGKFASFEKWIKDFKAKWENEEYLKKHTPNLRELSIKAHSHLADWVPMYIGKSRHVNKRIDEHINKELHKTTYALKLMARKNLKDNLFQLKTIKVSVNNYDAIIPRIESQLRNQLNPVIGKQ